MAQERNSPCRCGSGLKYKRCHGKPSAYAPPAPPRPLTDEEKQKLAEAAERAAAWLSVPLSYVGMETMSILGEMDRHEKRVRGHSNYRKLNNKLFRDSRERRGR